MGLLCFSKSLSGIANTPDHVKCISLYNQQCMTQLTLINSHNEYIEGLRLDLKSDSQLRKRFLLFASLKPL